MAVCLALVLPATSGAHGGGTIGFAVVSTGGATVRYTLSLPIAAITPDLAREIRLGEAGDGDFRPLLRLIERAVHVSGDGRACTPGPGQVTPPPQPSASVVAVFEYRCAAPPRVLSIRDDLFDTLSTDYRTLAHIEVPGGARPFTFEPEVREVRVDLVRGIVAARPDSYFLLGIDRMLKGLAQLLFLVALVVGADSLRAALSAVAAFVAGHSATVALAATGLVVLSPGVSAVLAPAAAAAAAALNLFPIGLLAPGAAASALLGALQGFSLSQALTAAPLPAGERAEAILHFNLGLATGTLIIVLIALPLWLWLWRRWARRARIGTSWPVLLAGLALCFSRA